MAGHKDSERAGLIGLARKLIEYWALLGGLVLFGIVLMSTWSVTSSFVFGAPVPGDFETPQALEATDLPRQRHR